MKKIILPTNYIESIGLKETFFLSFLIDTMPKCNSFLPVFQVTTKNITSENYMRTFKIAETKEIISKLYDFGFVFKVKKSNKITKSITVNVMNMIAFDCLGVEKYVCYLKDIETNKYVGKYIGFDSVDEFTTVEEFSFDFLNSYVRRENIKDDFRSICSFNIKKASKQIKDNEFIPKESELKINIESCFLQNINSPFISKEVSYGEILRSGAKGFALPEFEDEDTDSDSSSTFETEKDKARNDLNSYYKYLKIGETMKKPVLEWTPRDFIAYIYCGMAKMREEFGDFIFPDFSKDAYRIKILMSMYGNKRLQKLIYYSYKMPERIEYSCRIKNFKPTISTFFIEWQVVKIFEFIEDYENNKEYDALAKKLREAKQVKREEVELEKSPSPDKLLSLRDRFNTNKQEK